MASKKVPPIFAQAVIEKCKLCDRGEDETFFCTNCKEEMCKHCKTSHQRSKGSRNHKVISIAEDKDTSTNTAKINCTVHQKELVQMYCTNCKVLVCHTCIAGKHKSHTFDKLADVTDKFKNKIFTRVNDIKQEVQAMKSDLQSMEGNKKDYIKDTDDAVDNINKKRNEWKSQADSIADGLIQQVQDYKNHDLQQMDKRCKQIQDLISEKEDMLRSYKEINQSANLDTIIKCGDGIQKDDKPNPVPIYASSPKFVTEGPVDLTEIFSHLKIDKENVTTSTFQQQDVNVMKKKSSKAADTSGKSSTIDNTVIAEFKPPQRVTRVSVIGDKHAWMSGCGLYNVRLVDIDGNVIKDVQLDIDVYDIKATTEGEVFITEDCGHQIQKYNTDGKCVTIADMSPLYTHGLCITSNNELLVCLSSLDDSDDDEDDDEDVNNNKVVRMTMNGKVKQTTQYDQHKQPLYTNPSYVTENINRDVCVVDKCSTVVVVNKDGVLRFRYPDTAKSSNTIVVCNGIACDGLGNILVSDYGNDNIQQIDINGKFIRYILTEQHGINRPWGLDVDTEGKLWICDYGNNVKIVKYRS